MTTFYLDPVNGNDAADGSTFSLVGLPTVGPWKTITSGPTAARIAPGDVIRIAKSPDPTSLGQTALFTNLSRDVVLQTGAVTAEIEAFDNATTNWTTSADVNETNTTAQYKLGSNSFLLQPQAAFTTGKISYRDFGAGNEKNLSAYQQISLWFRNNIALPSAGDIKIKLCSDASGDVAVNTFSLPAIPSTNQWIPITLDNGSALGSSIRSVSIWMDTDLGAIDLFFDNLIACKDPTQADSVTLQSLISKNSAAQGGTEPWYAIQSINNTTIRIDNHTNCAGNAGRGYTGTTETVTIYKRETIKTTMVASIATVVQTIQDSGSLGSFIEFQGGYNTSNNSQDGETFFDGLNGWGYGLYGSNKCYLEINRLNCIRYDRGIKFDNPSGYEVVLVNCFVGNCSNYGFDLNNVGILRSTGNIIAYNCGAAGVQLSCRLVLLNNVYVYGNLYGGGNIYHTAGAVKITNLVTRNGTTTGYGTSQVGESIIQSYTSADNGGNSIVAGFGFNPDHGIFILSSSVGEGTVFSRSGLPTAAGVTFKNFNGTAGNHRIYNNLGDIFSEGSVRHTASGLAWSLSPKVTDCTVVYPLFLKVAEIAVNADSQVTVSLWMRRTNTGVTGSLVCRGGQIAGVDNDVKTDMTAAVDTWEQVQIQFTPTEAGVVEIEAWAYGGTTYSVYVDDLAVDQ